MTLLKKQIKKFTKFRTRVRTRHPSHQVLRVELPLLPFRSVVRLGSTTHVNIPGIVECNSIQGVKNSSNKKLMKACFTEAGVKTADWWTRNNAGVFIKRAAGEDSETLIQDLPYPLVTKHIFGSRGTGNSLVHSQEELEAWLVGKDLSKYIFEKFYNYNREYRLHVSTAGCFYTCRKMLKQDTPEDQRWFRNDSNSVWIMEENPQFDKPSNWEDIVNECVKAVKAVGLDIAGFDVRVQSSHKANGQVRANPEFIIIESNSACSFGEVTSKKYLEEIPKILKIKKANEPL